MDAKVKSKTYFWAKTTPDGRLGVSAYEHMRNVGHVAQLMAVSAPELLARFGFSAQTVGAIAAIHDLGKVSPGFQRKCLAWLEENQLAQIDRNWSWDTALESDHGKVSHAAIQVFLSEIGFDWNAAKYLSAVIGAHHGRLKDWPGDPYRPSKPISEEASSIDWQAERMACARMIWDHFADGVAPISLSDDSPSLWWLAGLASVSDWIGSDERFFRSDREANNENAAALAQKALDTIGFKEIEYIENLSFHDLFHDRETPDMPWLPNEMQKKAFAAIKGPGVYVIEAPMGTGKTEAALWVAYNLLVSGKARGIYFALPTQATSNRMHLRMNDFLRRISLVSDASRLIHGNSWLTDQAPALLPISCKHDLKDGDVRVGRDWFASAKRALIAPFGVGTIDQALLGVVAAKHFFVRHFALAGKVVILDEIHSYDLYTGTLIDELITALEGLGCTVIILSATLTSKRLRQITPLTNDDANGTELPYPLITGRLEGNQLEPLAIAPPKSRTVKVDFVAAEKIADEAIELARNGGAVLWICSTVDAAQKQYRLLTKLACAEFPIGLLHSRFPFWRREEIENEWMARFGKGDRQRCGSILVSTQIVEQSVDLDADLLITELAPTDMLLQRLGRLWRHDRERPAKMPRMCIIDEKKTLEEFKNMEPGAIANELGSKAGVYAPYVLLRSLEVWQRESEISIPSQIRPLLEATYQDREEIDAWAQLDLEWRGTDSAKKMLAQQNCNHWQPALEDTEGIQTRLNEMPTIDLVLCKELDDQKAIFVDGSRGLLKEGYRLDTAQAIHKNLVRVPKHCFDRVETDIPFAEYLFGEQGVGIVSDSGNVAAKGLRSNITLFYSTEFGLVIEK